jgi:isopenicillin-N N-acyltransferase-like protein
LQVNPENDIRLYNYCLFLKKRLHKFLRVSLKILLLLIVLAGAGAIYLVFAMKQPVPDLGDKHTVAPQVETLGPEFRRAGNNWLKKSHSGLWEMYLEGEAFERGLINGKLTQDLAEYQEEVFINQIKELVPSEGYLRFLKYFVGYFNRHLSEHISPEYLQEIYGVSLSASDKFDRLAPKYYRILNYHSAHDIGHALQDKNLVVGCTSFGVKNSRSADGRLLVGRNFDFFAGDDFARNKIVCFTRPATGYKFMYVTWAGFTGVVSGMNEQGLSVTINASKSDIPKSAATPISLLTKEILQYARTIDEAYEIASKRQTFVSESILIASSADRGVAIIEKTPNKTNLYAENGDELICSNHYMSPLFANDYINSKNIVESSSLYRKLRMQQLLAGVKQVSPAEAAAILRDQKGLNGRDLGLTNEKSINQLIAHHSVIFQPEDLRVWVSTSPYQSGEYVCYDLQKIFREAPGLRENREIHDSSLRIPADPFIYSNQYRDFLLFKQLKYYIQYCTRSPYDLKVEDRFIRAFEASNPENYLTYWILGDYYARHNHTEAAIREYETALSKEVATQKEADAIRRRLTALKTN